jgi:KDO2-lipid IV(A) lauroyltransferase
MTTREALPATAPTPAIGSPLAPALVKAVAQPRLDPHRSPSVDRPAKRDTRASYRVSVLTVRLCSWIVWMLPPAIRDAVARLGGWVFYRFSQTYRENVRRNLERVLGPSPADGTIERATRGVFRTSARNFGDLIVSPHQSRSGLIRSVTFSIDDRRLLDRSLAEGKGAVIVSAHIGAFDLIGKYLHHLGYDLTVVTARTTSRFIFDGVTYLRGHDGPAMVEPTPAGLRRTIQALRQGRCVAILGDRDFLQNGKSVVFFGRETSLPVGALRLAREAGAPIVPLFTRRSGAGHELIARPPIRVAKTTDPETDVAAGLGALVPVFEEAIRRSPDQWVMFQPVWPESPVDPVRAFPVGSPFAAERERSPVGRLRARLGRLLGRWRR